MTPISNHRFTSFSTPTRPAGYRLQAMEFNTDMRMERMLQALTSPPRGSPTKKTIKPSAPRRFSWEG